MKILCTLPLLFLSANALGGTGGKGPAWTYDKSVEQPAGTKCVGWISAVYTKEQQERLGVDENGNKPGAPVSSDVNGVKRLGLPGPAWTFDNAEAPAGTKCNGYTSAVYTKDQQKRLGVNEYGKTIVVQARALGAIGAIGPSWTYDNSVEKPAGTKCIGGWKSAVYTKEQQERLGVDENGIKLDAPIEVLSDENNEKKKIGAVGPSWTYDDNTEAPAGTKCNGGYMSAVYTKEQQQRLGVDENGKKSVSMKLVNKLASLRGALLLQGHTMATS